MKSPDEIAKEAAKKAVTDKKYNDWAATKAIEDKIRVDQQQQVRAQANAKKAENDKLAAAQAAQSTGDKRYAEFLAHKAKVHKN